MCRDDEDREMTEEGEDLDRGQPLWQLILEID